MMSIMGFSLLLEAMIFHVQAMEIVMLPQDYVNVLVEGGDLLVVVKFIYSEKATKFCEIFPFTFDCSTYSQKQ